MIQSSYDEKERLWSPAFLLLFTLTLMTSSGFYMTMPTLPKYAVSIGMSLSLAGMLTGIFSIVAIAARFAAGALADRANKKNVMVIANLLIGIFVIGYSYSTNAPSLFFFRILHGLLFAISSTVQLTMTSNIVPESRLGEGMGYMGISQILAMSFAPNLALYLVDVVGYARMFRISGGIIALAGFAMLLLPYHEKKPQNAHAAKSRVRMLDFIAPHLLLLAAMGGIFSVTNGVVSSFLSMLGDERGIDNISIFFTLSAVAVLAIRPFVGRVSDRKGLAYVLVPSFILGALAMLCVGVAWGIVPIVIASILKGASQSAGQVSIQAECAKRSPPEKRGVAMSTCYLGNDLGNSLGATIGGWLSGLWGYGSMFIAVAIMALSGLLLLAVQKRMDSAHENP